MHELGLGIRLDTYAFTDAQMRDALGRLLGGAGQPLRERLAGAAAAIRRRDGVRKAADLIEQAGRDRGGAQYLAGRVS
jgi:UDP:flavonoid glycosyltransferase YjiC (YdhE family)